MVGSFLMTIGLGTARGTVNAHLVSRFRNARLKEWGGPSKKQLAIGCEPSAKRHPPIREESGSISQVSSVMRSLWQWRLTNVMQESRFGELPTANCFACTSTFN
jgi:hypothetical protein